MGYEMNILSLFDGISCGQIAINRLNIDEYDYYASEIKPNAIKLTKEHFPKTIHIGDVTKVSYNNGILHTENGSYNIGKVDLLMGGSPCQDFSVLKINSKGLDGDKSKLFYEFLRILKEVNPTYYLLENIRMKPIHKSALDEYLGVTGILIDSKLVSYQTRSRYYWSNIPNIKLPKDKNINFQDFKDMDINYCKKYKTPFTKSRIKMWNNGNGKTDSGIGQCKNITYSKTIQCITRKQDRGPNSGLIEFDGFCRFLTQRELKLGQTLPLNYTESLSYNQAQDVIGDGWTVDIIVHILNYAFKKGGSVI